MGAKFSGGGIGSHTKLDIGFTEVISLENLLTAWYEFRRGKRNRKDIQIYEHRLEDNIFSLHLELLSGSYNTEPYHQFRINDSKPRLISKASVRDRLVHNAIYRLLYPLYDQTFIFDSYSCRDGKGTHKAFERLQRQILSSSQNHTKPCFALKCDIRRFFDSIDHAILLILLEKKIADPRLLQLLQKVIDGFEVTSGKGMPIGNLTSQLFANLYLDPLDKFVKHKLKARYYLRYADDFLILANTEAELMGYLVEIWRFLKEELKLQLHTNKLSLRKLAWGIDFVGYVALPHYALPRRKTVKRIFKKIDQIEDSTRLSVALDSHLGYLQHADAFTLRQQLSHNVYQRYTEITRT